jgi:hypothetical protein
MTIRDMVKAAQTEIRDTSLSPTRARELLMHLSALLGNCGEEIRAADMQYAVVLLEHLERCEKATHAKMWAETTPEYGRKREAHDTRELIVELTRSLKYYLRSLEHEMELSR